MEYLIPNIMLVGRGIIIAVLITLALLFALRTFDNRSDINFKKTWKDLDESHKTQYLCVRMVCFTIVFIFAFTIA